MLKTLLSKTSLRVKLKFQRAMLQHKLRTATIFAQTEERNAKNALQNAQFYRVTASILKYRLEDLS